MQIPPAFVKKEANTNVLISVHKIEEIDNIFNPKYRPMCQITGLNPQDETVVIETFSTDLNKVSKVLGPDTDNWEYPLKLRFKTKSVGEGKFGWDIEREI